MLWGSAKHDMSTSSSTNITLHTEVEEERENLVLSGRKIVFRVIFILGFFPGDL